MNKLYKETAIKAALKSGLFVKSAVGKTGKITYKGRDNIVTDIDIKAEAIIIKNIRSAFPDHSILSEETRPINPSSPYKWIVDPLDGTTNFAHAFPFFCISIAFEAYGKAIIGVVYDPMRDELFSAGYKEGAYLNKRRIRVSRVSRLSESFLATGFSYGRRKKDKNVKNFRKFLIRALGIRRAGSAALDLCYVACARFDGFWEMDLHPWDSAAGTLVVREAGGVVTKFDGSDYTPYEKEILATNGLIHNPMIKSLKDK